MFRHHPDGYIYVDNYKYPLAWFQQQEPNYVLPAPAITREYVPGVRHTLSDGDNAWGDVFPWPDGDTYISKATTYNTNYQAYVAANPPPTPPVN